VDTMFLASSSPLDSGIARALRKSEQLKEILQSRRKLWEEGGRQIGEGEEKGKGAMEMPIVHDGDRYEHVRDTGSGNIGVARLGRTRRRKYYLESATATPWCTVSSFGFIVCFRLVCFTTKVVRFNGRVVLVKQVCHRDLKPENTLPDRSTAPRIQDLRLWLFKLLLSPKTSMPETRLHYTGSKFPSRLITHPALHRGKIYTSYVHGQFGSQRIKNTVSICKPVQVIALFCYLHS
jgi:hypothetical protein